MYPQIQFFLHINTMSTLMDVDWNYMPKAFSIGIVTKLDYTA